MGKKGDKSAKDHSESSEDESESDFNVKKYREMLQKMFPSKYMKDKVVSLYQGTKKMIAKKCHGTCKKKIIWIKIL